eukprot:8283057-Pyramimonas_sp.AAC.1
MGSEDRAASPMRLDVEPVLLHADIADASPMSAMCRQCIADASPMHRRCTRDLARSSDPIYPDPI